MMVQRPGRFYIAREYQVISQGDDGGGYETVVAGGGVRLLGRFIVVHCQSDHLEQD